MIVESPRKILSTCLVRSWHYEGILLFQRLPAFTGFDSSVGFVLARMTLSYPVDQVSRPVPD